MCGACKTFLTQSFSFLLLSFKCLPSDYTHQTPSLRLGPRGAALLHGWAGSSRDDQHSDIPSCRKQDRLTRRVRHTFPLPKETYQRGPPSPALA